MPHITILSQTYAWGGLELHTLELAQQLARDGYGVRLLDVGSGGFESARSKLESAGVILECAPSLRRLSQLGWQEARQLARLAQDDVVIWPQAAPVSEGTLWFDWALWRHAKRFVTIAHSLPAGPPPPEQYGGLVGRLRRLFGWRAREMMRRAWRGRMPHRTICVSAEIARRLVQDYGFPASRVSVVHNGVDLQRFRFRRDARDELRQKLGISDHTRVFGYVGRMSNEKGILRLVQYLRASGWQPSTDCPAALVLVGEGPDLSAIQAEVIHLSNWASVHILGYQERPEETYPAFDVFLFPSVSEGLGLALLEAMASGCVPIAMAVGGIPEVITERSGGYLVRGGDLVGFAERMSEVGELSHEDWAGLQRQARLTVEARFDAERQTHELIRELLGRTTEVPQRADAITIGAIAVTSVAQHTERAVYQETP